MNRGLIEKTLRETLGTTLLFGCALFLAEGLLAYALPTFQEEISSAWLRLGLIKDILRALLGAEIGETFGPGIFSAVPWVHPVPLAIVWAHAIILSSRFPAGEVDRGTVDVLLGLPVSRFQVYLSETLVWLASASALSGFLVLGNFLGTLASRDGRPLSVGAAAAILANFLLLDAAVAGVGWLASSLARTRPRAIAVVFSILLASYLLNFLAQLWPVARDVAFSSILTYYRPLRMVEGADCPLGDMAVLGSVALVSWGAGAFVLARRDISTV
jgi:hypothetical protein